jgi:hypothetical protein
LQVPYRDKALFFRIDKIDAGRKIVRWVGGAVWWKRAEVVVQVQCELRGVASVGAAAQL